MVLRSRGSLSHYTSDLEFIRANLYPVLTDIIEWHVRGTRYGIRVDEDGLLNSGEKGVQLPGWTRKWATGS